MNKKPKPLTRDEYAARLAEGQVFRDAAFYEDLHAPKGTEFFLVDLGNGLKVYKRRIK